MSFSITERRVLGFDEWIVVGAISPLFSLFSLEIQLAFKILEQSLSLDIFGYQSFFFFNFYH
jgi:hypothetical protein